MNKELILKTPIFVTCSANLLKWMSNLTSFLHSGELAPSKTWIECICRFDKKRIFTEKSVRLLFWCQPQYQGVAWLWGCGGETFPCRRAGHSWQVNSRGLRVLNLTPFNEIKFHGSEDLLNAVDFKKKYFNIITLVPKVRLILRAWQGPRSSKK